MTVDQTTCHLRLRLSGVAALELDAILAANHQQVGQLEDEVRARNTVIHELRAELAEHRRLGTLGGPPVPFTTGWANRAVGAGVHPDYRGRL